MAKNRPFKRGFAKRPTSFNQVYVAPAQKRMGAVAPRCGYPACRMTATTRVMLTTRSASTGHPEQTDLCEHHLAARYASHLVRQTMARYRSATPAGDVHVAQVHPTSHDFDQLFDGGRLYWTNDMPVSS